jgi:type IV secretory pathway VirB6-like protein
MTLKFLPSLKPPGDSFSEMEESTSVPVVEWTEFYCSWYQLPMSVNLAFAVGLRENLQVCAYIAT